MYPIFPLNSVVFPKQSLKLTIFENRYLEMLDYCNQNENKFVTALIKTGNEVGDYAVPCSIGTLVSIKNIGNRTKLGIPISIVGLHRVEILSTNRKYKYLTGETRKYANDEAINYEEYHLKTIRSNVTDVLSQMATISITYEKQIPIPKYGNELFLFTIGLVSYILGGNLQEILREKKPDVQCVLLLKKIETIKSSLETKLNDHLSGDNLSNHN